MSDENNKEIPKEDDTQNLNKMAAELRALANDMNIVKAELAKKTNPDMLSAFAQIIKDALEQQKTEMRAEFIETLRAELEPVKTQLGKLETELKTELNNLKVATLEEFKQVKRELRNIDRRFHQITKDMGEAAMRTDDLEDRVEQIETKLATKQ